MNHNNINELHIFQIRESIKHYYGRIISKEKMILIHYELPKSAVERNNFEEGFLGI